MRCTFLHIDFIHSDCTPIRKMDQNSFIFVDKLKRHPTFYSEFLHNWKDNGEKIHKPKFDY